MKTFYSGLKAQNTKLKDEVFVTTQVLEQLATPKVVKSITQIPLSE